MIEIREIRDAPLIGGSFGYYSGAVKGLPAGCNFQQRLFSEMRKEKRRRSYERPAKILCIVKIIAGLIAVAQVYMIGVAIVLLFKSQPVLVSYLLDLCG